MKFRKTILTLLAAMLAVIGTTGTVVVHADGPDTPPETTETAPAQNIDAYLDQASRDLVNEMNSTFQGFVADAWTDLKQIAPSGDWKEVIRDTIPQIHANAEAQGGLLGSQGASGASNNCTLTYYSQVGSSGWAAAVTKSSCRMNFLRAEVAVQRGGGPGAIGSCSNNFCKRVVAYVNGLPCGNIYVLGTHEWGYNPSGGDGSSASGDVIC